MSAFTAGSIGAFIVLLVAIIQIQCVRLTRAREGREKYRDLYDLAFDERAQFREELFRLRLIFSDLRISIWGNPPLMSREPRDILKWVRGVKKEYAECQHTNTVMVATLQNYSHQLREKSGYIGELRKEMEEIRKGCDEFELAYVETKEHNSELRKQITALENDKDTLFNAVEEGNRQIRELQEKLRPVDRHLG